MFDTFPNFPLIPNLRAVISTRDGGVSGGEFASLNLGYHVGDDPARVSENRRRLGRAVGYDPAALVAARQVHGIAVRQVGAAERGRGAFSWESALADTDALVTAATGVPLAIQVADCAPVLLVDPVRHLLAVAHAGWRGALGGIASNTARCMIGQGTDPAKLVIGIGPTLCPACLEIGEEVAAQVAEKFGEAALLRGAVKPHLDIRALIAADLATVGVQPRQIFHHPDCTRCNNARFFSHRGQQGHAGRFALVAWWEG